jgi:ribosomal protein S18 acetylase RimI-like enzyme
MGVLIEYRESVEGVETRHLGGFFEGWANPPSPETHLALLSHSDEIVLALSRDEAAVVGFVTALTDHVLTGYISLLEVRPDFRRNGIGRNLVRRILARMSDLYMIDVACDPELQAFYESLGFTRSVGASLRRYERQAGTPRSVDPRSARRVAQQDSTSPPSVTGESGSMAG